MDLFSFATNIQQMAIGGVNFVNKLRKKSSVTNSNCVAYYVIGEEETNPEDMNIFFLPFANVEKMKLKEFKEYFPFKDNVIFRFRVSVKDLIDVINEGFRSGNPLLNQKKYVKEKTEMKMELLFNYGIEKKEKDSRENKNRNQNRNDTELQLNFECASESETGNVQEENKTEDLSNYIISDETEIKNITKPENGHYVWVDITNENAQIPLYEGKIIAKVLFINKENYRKYDEIYYKEYISKPTPVYNINEKHLYSYIAPMQQETYSTSDSKEMYNKREKDYKKKEKEINKKEEGNKNEHSKKDMFFNVNKITLFNSNAASGVDHNMLDIAEKSEDNSSTSSLFNSNFFQSEKIRSDVDSNNIINNIPKFYQNSINNDDWKKKNMSTIHNNSIFQENVNENEHERQNESKRESESCFFPNDHLSSEQEKKTTYANGLFPMFKEYSHDKKTAFSKWDKQSVHYSNNMNNNKNDANTSTNNNINVHNMSKKDLNGSVNIRDRLRLKQESLDEENRYKEKLFLTDKMKKQIDKWCKNSDDTYKDIKVMLSTLHVVLWDNCDWKPVPMSELITNPKFAKKCYRNAIILCHPDKNRDKPVEQMLKAELIFQALNNSFKNKATI